MKRRVKQTPTNVTTVNAKKCVMKAKKLKVEGEKILDLTQKIEALEGEKAQLEAEYCKVKEDNRNQAEKIFNVNKAFEDENNRLDKARQIIDELVKWIGILERDKETEKVSMEEEGKKQVLELTNRIKVLEREKREIEANLCLVNREKGEEIKRILNEKLTMEAEFCKVKEDSRNEALRIRKLTRDLEAEKKRGETAREKILELVERVKVAEKMAMEDEGMQKVLELTHRIEVLEREKREIETEVCQAKKDGVIKVLAHENSCLEDKKIEIKMEINGLASNSMDDVQLPQHPHLTNNFFMLSMPLLNEGQSSTGVALSSEHTRSINHNVQNSDGQYEDEMTRTHDCKRKRSTGKWEEPGPTNGSLSNGDGLQFASGNIAFEWVVDQDMLDALDVYPELCLKAVCALYRQHQRLGNPTNTSLSSEGIALAEYLISEDPECRKTKKMVAKLDKFDRDAVGECIKIAKQHYKQVFEIYKKKEDPVFLS